MQQHINYGTTDNDGTGDVLREFARKSEQNFNELYAGVDLPISGINLFRKWYFAGVLNTGDGIEPGDLCKGPVSNEEWGEVLQYVGPGDDQDISQYNIISSHSVPMLS